MPVTNQTKPLDNTTTDRDRIADDNGLISNSAIGPRSSSKRSGTNVYRYPENLGDDENPHYVMFFINVPEIRADANHASNKVIYEQTNEVRITSNEDVNKKVLTQSGALAGAAAGGLAGLFSGSTATTWVGRLGSKVVTAPAGAVAGALVGAGAGAVAGSNFLTFQRLVHMPVSIALGIQGKPSVSYGADWQDEEMGSLQSLASGADVLRTGEFGLRDEATRAASIPKMAGLGFDYKNFVNKIERRIRNPGKEQLFKSMGFREFKFEYNFLPRSKKEAEEVQNIIRLFKQYMHPEISYDKLFMLYPAEFNIIYYYKDKENQFLNKIASCALRNIEVTFGGQDFTVFKNTGGMPSEIFMTLNFVELETMTAQRINGRGISAGPDRFGF